MKADDLWNLFMETGAPELYLMYHKAKKTEACHVSDDTGTCPAGHRLQ